MLGARFDQYRMLVGQVTRQFIVVPHDLRSGLVEGWSRLGHPPRPYSVHDAHGLDAALAQVKERTVVVARGQGVIHFLQPIARVVGTSGTLRQRSQQGADHGAGNQPVGPLAHRPAHGATCAAASLAAGCCSSASISKSAITPRRSRPDEYRLWANT